MDPVEKQKNGDYGYKVSGHREEESFPDRKVKFKDGQRNRSPQLRNRQHGDDEHRQFRYPDVDVFDEMSHASGL